MYAQLNYVESTGPVTRVALMSTGVDPRRSHFCGLDDDDLEDEARDLAGVQLGTLVDVDRGDEPDSAVLTFEREA